MVVFVTVSITTAVVLSLPSYRERELVIDFFFLQS